MRLARFFSLITHARGVTVFQRSLCSRHASDEDSPVAYSTSKAAHYKARETFRPPPSDAPAAQKYSVVLSLCAVLIYFCVLREENDVDDLLGRPLSDSVPGISKLGAAWSDRGH